ncbi:MAG: 2-oxoacid:acceptor oxidoreductase subunit alpha [Candidatus Marsarchaeota archaeon]|nr:2-oxoacid:acceptor oxidoreductase subunit alpha [Candidatus Marsarchaeota archaeon]
MRVNDVTLKVGGEAGSGILTVGNMFAKLMQKSGLQVFLTNDYPSLIKGGHNTITVRVAAQRIWALAAGVDILIALDKKTVQEHCKEMRSDGAIIYDSAKLKEEDVKNGRTDVRLVGVPLSKIATEAGGDIFFNQAAMGAMLALLGMDLAKYDRMIEKTFGRKGEQVVEQNRKVVRAGADFLKANYPTPFGVRIEPVESDARTMLLNGNDAVCAGALAAGVQLVAEYPMSPSSSVLHWMAAHAVKYNVVVKHTEDEIAAMNWLCGAGFAGVRCMTATSGGGFSLMAEALGNAGIAEIPCVVIEDQRCGPSTGLPTYTEQADLRFALHASQGEFPRIVACPGDPQEAFWMAVDVFNMADLVQTPAIILMDKYLAEAAVTIPSLKAGQVRIDRGLLQTDAQMADAVGFKRHALSPSGISPRCIPGQKNGIHVCSSYEHDETGFTSEEPHMRISQIDKRARKMKAISPLLCQPAFFGAQDSDSLLVSWGSTKGVVMEALKQLEKEGKSVRFMHIRYAAPFAADTISSAIKRAKKCLIIEGNSEGQMRDLIREKTGLLVPQLYCRYDGRPFEAEEVAAVIRERLLK